MHPGVGFQSLSSKRPLGTQNRSVHRWEKIHMAIFLHKLPYRKNAMHFLTMAIFPYGNFPIHLPHHHHHDNGYS